MKTRVPIVVVLLIMLLLMPQAVVASTRADPAAPEQRQHLFLPALHLDQTSVEAAKKTAPPNSHAFGKTLGEWIFLYSRWILGDLEADHIGHVRFMPLPEGAGNLPETPADPFILTGHQDVTLSPGTPFVLPLFMLIGERYADGSEDSPPPAEVLTSTQLVVKLDGKIIIDSNVDDLSRYYFGPVTYPSPIDTELPDGSLHTFIWVQGIGLVRQPLSVGEHTITLSLVNNDPRLLAVIGLTGVASGIGYENSWTIRVEP